MKMTKPLLSKGEAKALADKLVVLLTTTDIAKGGCTVCGNTGHVAVDHDMPLVKTRFGSDLNLDAVRVGAQRSLGFAAEHANGREYLPEAVFDFFDRDLPAVLDELERLRAELVTVRVELAILRALECDGGKAGGFFPTACGRDFLHPSHPLGLPPTVTRPSSSGGAS
jgi:hypothetical protein